MSKDRTQAIPAFIDLAAQRERLGDSVERAISAVLNMASTFSGPRSPSSSGSSLPSAARAIASVARTAPMRCCSR